MGDYVNVKELFGCDVFNDSVMQDRLPKKVYKELKKTMCQEHLDPVLNSLIDISDNIEEPPYQQLFHHSHHNTKLGFYDPTKAV